MFFKYFFYFLFKYDLIDDSVLNRFDDKFLYFIEWFYFELYVNFFLKINFLFISFGLNNDV